MRILHIFDHSLPLHSGYTFRSAAILREQKALGWETLQLTTPRHGRSFTDEEVCDGWRFYRTSFSPGWRSRLVPAGRYLDEMAATERRVDELVQEFRPDILHSHSPVLNALPALAVGRRRGIPVVYEMRASWEDAAVDHGSTRRGSVRYRLSRALESYALRRVDSITTICEGLVDDIAARGIDRSRVTVIPNAVDVSLFRFGQEPDPALRRELGLDDAAVLGFAGSFYGYEGLDLLIEAAAELLPIHPRLFVLLVGGGPQEAQLRAKAASMGLQDRVIFTGRVRQEEVQRYYNLIDVLAYPRKSIRLTELVTPLKPLEAMAQGRMLVASDVGGHRELIRHGENGFLFKAGDVGALAKAIAMVLARRDEWPSIARQARRFVETERTWARSVSRYGEVYGRLLEGWKAGGVLPAPGKG